MFKEAITGVLFLCLLWLLLRILKKKNPGLMARLALGLTALFCLANIVYNSRNIFPDFYMDIINGRFRYGTFSGNLFAYSDEFMFQDEILFPILRGRHVTLDESAGFYEKFFGLYADSLTLSAVPEAKRQAVLAHADSFDFCHEFSCIGIMDYVTETLPPELAPAFEEEVYPLLYINTASLQGQRQLRLVMDEDYTIYLMSEPYYQEITGGTEHV